MGREKKYPHVLSEPYSASSNLATSFDENLGILPCESHNQSRKGRLPPVSREYKITLPTSPDGGSIKVRPTSQSSYHQSSAYQSVGNQPSIDSSSQSYEQIPVLDLKLYFNSNLNSQLNVSQSISMPGAMDDSSTGTNPGTGAYRSAVTSSVYAVMSRPGQPGALHFDGRNVTEFLEN
jgi:hypothetical protein